MHKRGKLVVLAIFAVAVAMASFALWWNWGLGKRSLEFWGIEGGLAIRDAKKVELLKLRMQSGRIADLEAFEVVETKDISKASGLVHARHSLLEDASFDWNANLVDHPEFQPRDYIAVRFSHQDIVKTIVFIDMPDGLIVDSKSGHEVVLSPKTSAGWKQFISRYFPMEAPKSSRLPAKSK